MRRAVAVLAIALAGAAPASAKEGSHFWPQLFQLGGAPTAYREDAPHVSGHFGNFVLAVRNDAGGTLCNASGDYCPFQLDASGQVRVVAPLPSGAATDRTTAAAPFAFRLSDGAAFYAAPAAAQLPAALDGSGLLKVHEQGTATVSGAVTANAGTNLNTSGLAVEAGGNLAAIKTDADKIPADPAREGGNLATVATKNTSIDSKLPTPVNGALPVVVQQTVFPVPPVLSARVIGNPLLMRAAMQQYCQRTLCPPGSF